jgi:hypothetical protein
MESGIYHAIGHNDTAKVAEILSRYSVNLEWKSPESGRTLLHTACLHNRHEIVALLLAHRNPITHSNGCDVNETDEHYQTLFMRACAAQHVEIARLLIDDPRTDLNRTVGSKYGLAALYWAVKYCPEIIRWWIASGRELWLGGGTGIIKSAYFIHRSGKEWVVRLLERYKDDPGLTRLQVRLEMGMADEVAAEVLALVVFLSDGLLQGLNPLTPLTPVFSRSTSAARFFRISSKLPLELQMVLCYRLVGSACTNIPWKQRERGFRELAKELLSDEKN